MIEYTVMDYEGEPVTIKNGDMWDAEPPEEVYSDRDDKYYTKEQGDIYWDSDKCDWDIEVYDEPCGNDRELYGAGWYDCNTDWRNW